MEVASKNCSQMLALKPTKSLMSPVVKSRGARFLDMVRQSNLKTSPQITIPQSPATEVSLKGTGEPKTPSKKHILPHQESKCDRFNPKSSPTSSKRKIPSDTVNNSPSMSQSAKVC